MSPKKLEREARSWVGVPFRHQGRSRLGVDCVGLIEVVLTELKLLPVNFNSTKDYIRAATPELRRVVASLCEEVTVPGSGTIVLIKWPKASYAQHIAFCVNGNLIHSYQRVGRVVEHGYRPPWLKLTAGIFRIPGITYE